MSKLFGAVLLVGGSLMLYEGWQSHEAALSAQTNGVTQSSDSAVLWLLILSPVAMILGLFALLRRSIR